jgi:hypothetical protein
MRSADASPVLHRHLRPTAKSIKWRSSRRFVIEITNRSDLGNLYRSNKIDVGGFALAIVGTAVPHAKRKQYWILSRRSGGSFV